MDDSIYIPLFCEIEIFRNHHNHTNNYQKQQYKTTMKTNFASVLAFVPLLTIVTASEISDIYKKTLGNSDCTNIGLTDGHVLHATCTDPGVGKSADFDLELNDCFANYLGTLNHVTNGGFAGSCHSCHMDGTKLTCDCSTGHGSSKHNVVELNDWDVIQITEGSMYCGGTDGIEKRKLSKGSRFFRA
ncbi:uncharacterized protein F4822DRAFT_392833 [Hypoxylon trugodes]|uniref:uncharacterized protein n=1 Tax=Hypoxylon trugodes TaxID=326681 RepID=UPI0021949D55|nr:uncharacterized protein F4822DRAFT_392833 [Hypoxylon trugodes]KAI1393008.1 hypothetical protein F4822DRAFT_392833 [Hypoxylon trugodes]